MWWAVDVLRILKIPVRRIANKNSLRLLAAAHFLVQDERGSVRIIKYGIGRYFFEPKGLRLSDVVAG